MTADILALLSPQTPDTRPQGILAAADLREQRAKAASEGPWEAGERCIWSLGDGNPVVTDGPDGMGGVILLTDAEHIAAEANPAHALAAVRRWRGVVERHARIDDGLRGYCRQCYHLYPAWPCPDLTETADEARAYLGGSA